MAEHLPTDPVPKRGADARSPSMSDGRHEVRLLQTISPSSHAEWHKGEQYVQHLAGVQDKLAPHAARVFLPYLTPQLREFFPLLPFVALSFIDAGGHPWGTLLPGKPGFIWSPQPALVRVDRLPPRGDPLETVLQPGCPLGMLGIELPTRRRNRVNGIVVEVDATGFTLLVRQAYGNCPKYIQQRHSNGPRCLPDSLNVTSFDAIDDASARALLSVTDTAFVASYGPGPRGQHAMDISHRGGTPGFIRVDSDGCITVPEFSGNRYFNTLGNIHLTRRAAFVIPSFDSGDVLVLTGQARLCEPGEADDETALVPGAERLWRMFPQKGQWLRGALPLDFVV